MTPKRPYLLNAIHAWLLDNNETPYISVDADEDIGSIPGSAVKDGVVVLNVSPTAIESLDIGLDAMSFYCRFNGVRTSINLPMQVFSQFMAKSPVRASSSISLSIRKTLNQLLKKNQRQNCASLIL